MAIRDMLEPLTHVVQVRERGPGGGEWWETLAAFNVKRMADDYAEQCRKTGRAYRVEPVIWPDRT